MDKELKAEIEKQSEIHAVHNAIKFNGKANEKAVLGMIIKTFSEHKKEIPQMKTIVETVTKRINAMTLEDIELLAKDLPKPEAKEKKKEGLKELKNATKGKVVTRIEPSPSGSLHIGHAIGVLINYEYAKMYKGKMILRISDTNPDNIYPDAYQMIIEDTNWLCGEDVDVEVQSDRMELYYTYVEKLLTSGDAYVCSCDPEKFKALVNKKKPSPCRDNTPEENMSRWEEMLNDAPPGKYVVRMKTEVDHPNPAMRDWPALRINTTEHVRQKAKYRVWPLLNFAVAIDDHEMGLTHVLRGKDHADNTKRQQYIFKFLKWTEPEYIHWGRINFKGLPVSASETKKQLEAGDITGWDDIRIPFIRAFKRRGYQPEAFRKYAIANGVTLNDKTVTAEEFYKTLNAFNKDIIEKSSNRYFFIEDPTEINVEGAPDQDVKLKLHPDYPNKGTRELSTSNRFYIQKSDLTQLKPGLNRLMDCLNFEKNKDNYKFIDTDYATYKKGGKSIIHWLPASDDVVNVEILMPDHTVKKGLGEINLKDLSVGDIIQFERFGFCRLDEVHENVLKFWFAHK